MLLHSDGLLSLYHGVIVRIASTLQAEFSFFFETKSSSRMCELAERIGVQIQANFREGCQRLLRFLKRASCSANGMSLP